MAVAAGAADFCPRHAERIVAEIAHVVAVERLVKARPAGAGLEFLAGAEERQAAQAAGVEARLLVVQERAAERPLGAVVEQNVPLLRRELSRQPVALGGGDRPEVVAGSGKIGAGGRAKLVGHVPLHPMRPRGALRFIVGCRHGFLQAPPAAPSRSRRARPYLAIALTGRRRMRSGNMKRVFLRAALI